MLKNLRFTRLVLIKTPNTQKKSGLVKSKWSILPLKDTFLKLKKSHRLYFNPILFLIIKICYRFYLSKKNWVIKHAYIQYEQPVDNYAWLIRTRHCRHICTICIRMRRFDLEFVLVERVTLAWSRQNSPQYYSKRLHFC